MLLNTPRLNGYRFNIKKFYILPTLYSCHFYGSQSKNYLIHTIKRLAKIKETACVYCAVRHESLIRFKLILVFNGFNKFHISMSSVARFHFDFFGLYGRKAKTFIYNTSRSRCCKII
jgi:hypothetical protein